jgi:hypothetical protein
MRITEHMVCSSIVALKRRRFRDRVLPEEGTKRRGDCDGISENPGVTHRFFKPCEQAAPSPKSPSLRFRLLASEMSKFIAFWTTFAEGDIRSLNKGTLFIFCPGLEK